MPYSVPFSFILRLIGIPNNFPGYSFFFLKSFPSSLLNFPNYLIVFSFILLSIVATPKLCLYNSVTTCDLAHLQQQSHLSNVYFLLVYFINCSILRPIHQGWPDLRSFLIIIRFTGPCYSKAAVPYILLLGFSFVIFKCWYFGI